MLVQRVREVNRPATGSTGAGTNRSGARPGIPNRPALWRIADLCVRYGRREILSEITLEVGQGSITAVIGPSGCGKTSFLYCLNRMYTCIPGCCVSGRIYLETSNILDADIDERNLRRRIGLVFQRPNPFPFSIWRNFELPLREHGITDRTRVEQLVRDALEAVGLWDEVKDRLGESALSLSGGQQQRLCIGRALVLQPDTLLMDEPCSALDPMATSRIEALIQELRGRYTIILVTHNLAQAKRVATDVALFWSKDGSGCLVEAGGASEFFAEPKTELSRLYLEGSLG